MSATTDPTTGTVTIVLTRDELSAQYDVRNAYVGSDEWDLNDAFKSGYQAALDDLQRGANHRHETDRDDYGDDGLGDGLDD